MRRKDLPGFPGAAKAGAMVAGALAFSLGLAACSRAPAPAAQAAEAAPEGIDLSRPCGLLTPEMATQVSGMPYFRAMVVNAVNDDTVTCAHAVGAGGMQGLVRAVTHLPRAAGPAELRFAALCRGDAASRLSRQTTPGLRSAPEPTVAAVGDSIPVTQGRLCALPRGGYAILLDDRVMEVGYEQADGSMDPEISRLFAQALLNEAEAVPIP